MSLPLATRQWAVDELHKRNGVDLAPTDIESIHVYSEGDALVVVALIDGEEYELRQWPGGISLDYLEAFLKEVGLG